MKARACYLKYMHSPGVCGVILASGSQPSAGEAGSNPGQPKSKSKAEALNELISVLNEDTEMVLVALGGDAESLAPVVWARAAYVVTVAEGASEAEALRSMLQEVLNRGRDAALVASLDSSALTADTVHRMVATYCAAGDEIWAVVPETAMQQGHPVLMGRQIIELFLRGQKWSAADEILSANLDHVRSVKAVDPTAAPVAAAPWKAPWD
jgi:CTP:molybdopterin cytidylyltransferase MocA